MSKIDSIFEWLGAVLPKPDHIERVNFTNIFSATGFAVLAATLVVHILYILLQIWAKNQDLIDYFMYKRAIDINDIPSGTYRYLITIYTNWRPGSGTDAKVFIQLHGSLGQNTICYYLHNPYLPYRKLFGWSDVSWFSLNTSIPIGDIRSLTIAHDNSGTFAAWHLSKVLVKDLQKNRTRRFLANCWLMEDDGHKGGVRSSITLKPVDPDYVEPFGERMFEWARRIYTDRPLTSWYSLNYITSLTRSRRLTITYVYLMTLMLLNIAYFNKNVGRADTLSVLLSMTFRTGICFLVLMVLNIIFSHRTFTVRHPRRVEHYTRLVLLVILHVVCILQTMLILVYAATKDFDISTTLGWLLTFAFGILQSELMIAVGVTLSKAVLFTFFCKDPFLEEAAQIQLTERVTSSEPVNPRTFTAFTLPRSKE